MQPRKPAHESKPSDTAIHPQTPERIPVVNAIANRVLISASYMLKSFQPW
ncbi:Uncharacterised protein [Vibrio cholerae]|nr:Uncharacterised protein [Vibrio cholerae]